MDHSGYGLFIKKVFRMFHLVVKMDQIKVKIVIFRCNLMTILKLGAEIWIFFLLGSGVIWCALYSQRVHYVSDLHKGAGG